MKGNWIRRPPNNLTSVVFIHGILSSGEKCWRHQNGAYWPELLASEEQLTSTGVYVFTYQTGLFSGTYHLSDVVDALKEYMRLDDVLKSKRIVFVCHSMGGIVARKYVVERASELIEREIRVSFFLIASPSLGSDYANWLAPLARLFDHTQADALRFSQNNAWLMDLDREFLNLKERRSLSINGKELVEDKFIVLKSLLRRQVVMPFQGARYFGEPFKVPNSDHFSISKVEGKDAIQHRLLLSFLLEVIQDRVVSSPNSSLEARLARIEIPWISEDTKADIVRQVPSRIIRSEHFEASAESPNAGSLLKYRVHRNGQLISFFDALDLWERDLYFVEFYISIFKQSGYDGYIWETPAISAGSVHECFEFVIHRLPKSSGRPDREAYADYFDTEAAPDGIVSFKNLGGDALLIVPSPYRETADYSGMAEFFREAPIGQQRTLWRELGRHAKSRLSDRPMWLSVASGGIPWLHLRIDSTPKYYRYGPYTTPK